MFKSFAVAATVAAFAVLGGSAVANAAPMPVVPYSNSNTVVNQNGNDYFQATSPVWGAAVDAGPANSVDDNFVTQSSGPNSVRFELEGTNLCVADPGAGYGNVDAIVLRTCNGMQWQAFRRVDAESNGLAGLQSVATNQYITDNGQFAGLTGVADNRPCAVGVPCPPSVTNANEFNQTGSQLWKTGTHGFFPVVRLSATESQSVDNTHDVNSVVNYDVHVSNLGSENVHNLSVAENVVLSEVLSYGSSAETFTASASPNVVTAGYDTDLAAHSSEDVPGVLDLATFKGQTITFSNSAGTQTILMEVNSTGTDVTFSSSNINGFDPSQISSVHANVTETPTVTATVNGHVHTVDVTPPTETASF